VERLAALSQTQGGLDPRAAYQVCQENPSAAAHVIRAMLVKVGRPQAEIHSAVTETSQRQATRLLQMGSWLTLAAAVAPLIGLLGTVWGITQAFYETTLLLPGQNRSVMLADGIYTALVTTLGGLMIAIPAAILAHYFENRILRLMNDIEEMVFNLMPQLERYEGHVRFTIGDPAPVASLRASPPSAPERESANVSRQPSEATASGSGTKARSLNFPEPETVRRKPSQRSST
jgi:biopolymer transport protein ExbB